MTEHSNDAMSEYAKKADWSAEQLKRAIAASPLVLGRAVRCVNELAGLNPEAIPKLVKVARDLCHFADHAEYLEDLRQALVELEA